MLVIITSLHASYVNADISSASSKYVFLANSNLQQFVILSPVGLFLYFLPPLLFHGLHDALFRFQTFRNPCTASECLHFLTPSNIHCSILLNRALVPYLYLNTYTSHCRSRIKGMICKWPWIWLFMNTKLQAPENLFASLLMKLSSDIMKMLRSYVLFFYKLQKRNKCPRR
ncbi:hypothetical protein EDC04DRAFT_439969 [Pisolithus marmoratus]|nr:hypothetical protein EDC04DRAFT_439969 [Pisolithus marmoratus]